MGRSIEMTEMTTLEIYQDFVWNTTTPKEGDNGGWWACSGMSTEAGESLGLFEKAYRTGKPVNVDKLMDELGDVLWFLAATCNMMDLNLDEVMEHNINKIKERVRLGQVTSAG